MSSLHLGSRAVRALLLAALVVVLAVIGACALDDDDRDDGPGPTSTTTTTTDPSGTPSTGAGAAPTTAPPQGGDRFDADPLEPDERLGPDTPPPTIEPPDCVPEPGKACLHDGTDPADQ